MWVALPATASCQAQLFLPPACLGAAHLPAPSSRTHARCTPARCVRTRAAQVDVATENDVASISSALKEAIAAEDYALAAKLRDELQRLPEVELEARLRRAVEQEDYAVRQSAGPVGCGPGTTRNKCWVPYVIACKLPARVACMFGDTGRRTAATEGLCSEYHSTLACAPWRWSACST